MVFDDVQEQVKTEAYEMEVACWLNLAASFARLNRPVFLVLFHSFRLMVVAHTNGAHANTIPVL